MSSSALPLLVRKQRFRRLLQVALATVVALHAWAFVGLRKNVRDGYADFSIFYTAGKCLAKGLGSRMYDVATEKRLQREFISPAKIEEGPLPYTHPPFEAPLFVPLALLPYVTAYSVWNAISVLLLLGFVLLMRPYLPRLRERAEALPFLAALAFFPVFLCLFEGQDSVLLLFIFALVYVNMKLGREFVAGMCLALALFRFQIVLPILAVALLRRKWRLLTGLALVGIALTGISLAVVGWNSFWNYPRQLWYVYRLWELSPGQAGAALNPAYMPNLRGLTFALLGDGRFAHLLTNSVSLALVGFAAWKWNADPREPNFDLGFALTIAIAVMVSFHLNAYDMTLLLLPLLLGGNWVMQRAGSDLLSSRLVLVGIASLFLSPLWFSLRGGALFWAVLIFGLGLAVSRGEEGTSALAGSSQTSGLL